MTAALGPDSTKAESRQEKIYFIQMPTEADRSGHLSGDADKNTSLCFVDSSPYTEPRLLLREGNQDNEVCFV